MPKNDAYFLRVFVCLFVFAMTVLKSEKIAGIIYLKHIHYTKVTLICSLFDAGVADSDWVIPSSFLDWPKVGGAHIAHPLPTCPAVVQGQSRAKSFTTYITTLYQFIWYPV